MNAHNMLKICALVGLAAMATACGPATPEDTTASPTTKPGGGKGDTPNDDPDYDGKQQCENREQDMVFGSRKAFTRDGVRWAVADVEGVNTLNRDDRGQEYSEYFAVVRDIDESGEELLDSTTVLGLAGQELALKLTEDQEVYLEDNEFDEVGSCVFTSWHADMPPLACEEDESCPSIIGDRAISLDLMRMKVGFNSNSAARDLIARCLFIDGMDRTLDDGQEVSGVRTLQNGDPEDSSDILNRDFMRGCMHVDNYFQTGWRRSDPSVCAAAMRLAECGCSVEGERDPTSMILPTAAQQLEDHSKIVLRGFRLGGWNGVGQEHLPTGCEYIRTEQEDDALTMVKCSLTGGEVLSNLEDVKGYCRSKFATDLTVNVPLDAQAITCDGGDGPYGKSCGENPWVLEYKVTR